MYSADFDSPMDETYDHLKSDYARYKSVGGDSPHPRDWQHGGPAFYISHLQRDIAENGMREPITVRGGNVVIEGHHRAVAAMNLRMDKIPVRHIR